jgi:hypothetical protein
MTASQVLEDLLRLLTKSGALERDAIVHTKRILCIYAGLRFSYCNMHNRGLDIILKGKMEKRGVSRPQMQEPKQERYISKREQATPVLATTAS